MLKCIAGEQEPTYGTITLARGTRIGRVEQEVPPVLRNLTLRDSIGAMLPDEQLLSRGWEVDALLNTGFGSTPGSWSTSSIFRPADIHPSRISQRRAIGAICGGLAILVLGRYMAKRRTSD